MFDDATFLLIAKYQYLRSPAVFKNQVSSLRCFQRFNRLNLLTSFMNNNPELLDTDALANVLDQPSTKSAQSATKAHAL